MRITNTLRQLLISEKDYQKMISNGKKSQTEHHDPKPVVKLFTPDGRATWLLTEIDPDNTDFAF